MPPMTKTIKVSDTVYNDLIAGVNRSSKGTTINDYICCLFSICNDFEEMDSPEFKQKQERELKEKYVSKDQYNDLYKSSATTEKQLHEQIEDLEHELKLMKGDKNNIELRLKEQIATNSELESASSDKDNEISALKSDNENSLERQTEAHLSLHDIQTKYSTLAEKYNEQQLRIATFYFDKRYLETLYYIARFLKKYPKRLFTVDDIHDKFQWDNKERGCSMIIEDIKVALTLTEYKVLPVRCINTTKGIAFQYDRRYLLGNSVIKCIQNAF